MTEAEVIEKIVAALSQELTRTGQQVLIYRNGRVQYLTPRQGFL